MLGGSVFGYNDAYKRLHPFLKRWRMAQRAVSHHRDIPLFSHLPRHTSGSPITQIPDPVPWGQQEGEPPMLSRDVVACQQEGHGKPYIVSIDVSRAFDNIDAQKLLSVVEPLLQSQEYLIVKYAEVSTALSPSHCAVA